MSFTYEQRIDLHIDSVIIFVIQEMYKKPILDNIDNLVNDILDPERTIEKKYGIYTISIIPIDPKTRIQQPKKGKMGKYDPLENTLIYRAGYDQLNNIYKFEIRDDVDEMYDVKERLSRELKEMYVHENTHDQQNQLKHRLQPYDDGDGDLVKYLSQYQEIAAMARGVAYALESRSYSLDDKELIRAIVNHSDIIYSLPVVHIDTINLYRHIGGKVWKNFLKHVYLYFFYDPEAQGTVEYGDWLKKHYNQIK